MDMLLYQFLKLFGLLHEVSDPRVKVALLVAGALTANHRLLLVELHLVGQSQRLSQGVPHTIHIPGQRTNCSSKQLL